MDFRLQNTFLDVIEDCNLAELHSTALCGISELLNIYHLTGKEELHEIPGSDMKISSLSDLHTSLLIYNSSIKCLK